MAGICYQGTGTYQVYGYCEQRAWPYSVRMVQGAWKRVGSGWSEAGCAWYEQSTYVWLDKRN